MRAEGVKRDGSAVFNPDVAEKELVLLCGAHVFKKGKALRVLLAPFSVSPAVHEVTQRCNAVCQLT